MFESKFAWIGIGLRLSGIHNLHRKGLFFSLSLRHSSLLASVHPWRPRVVTVPDKTHPGGQCFATRTSPQFSQSENGVVLHEDYLFIADYPECTSDQFQCRERQNCINRDLVSDSVVSSFQLCCPFPVHFKNGHLNLLQSLVSDLHWNLGLRRWQWRSRWTLQWVNSCFIPHFWLSPQTVFSSKSCSWCTFWIVLVDLLFAWYFCWICLLVRIGSRPDNCPRTMWTAEVEPRLSPVLFSDSGLAVIIHLGWVYLEK